MMRALRFINLAFLTLLISVSGSLYAQDGKPQEPRQPRQEQPRPEARQDQMNAPQEQGNDMKPPRQDEAKPSKEEKKQQKEQEKQAHEQMKQNHQEMKQNDQMKDSREQNDQMKDNRQMSAQQNSGAHARPAGKSAHIPDDKFRSNFGRSHTVKVQRTTVVEGQQGFVYGGYSFVFVDPWPAEWAYTDDCYIDYIDGEYFLFDLLHPGVRIALFVVL
jgi:hypothetical protein